MLATLLLFAGGLVLLVAGAEALVRGASRLAAAAGVSPLVVGLTVVAYGTSSPELAIGVDAALHGRADLAVGNVIGSNVFNVLFILGLSAVIVPLVVHRQLVRVDVPIMIGVSALVLLLARDGRIGRGDGLLLVAALGAYTAFAVWMSRRESTARADAVAPSPGTGGRWMRHLLAIGAGLVLLTLGARIAVAAAIDVARSLGVSELVIALTLVAAGTSMPEVATSILAALRGERDIAVGNVVGSNIVNLLAVLGGSALAAPGGLPVSPAALAFDLPVALAVAVACLPIFASGPGIARWEGGVFLGTYVAYVVYLYLDTSGHALAPAYTWIMLAFVLPMTTMTVLVVAGGELLRARDARRLATP